jgi:hypothetical protein
LPGRAELRHRAPLRSAEVLLLHSWSLFLFHFK